MIDLLDRESNQNHKLESILAFSKRFYAQVILRINLFDREYLNSHIMNYCSGHFSSIVCQRINQQGPKMGTDKWRD